MALGAVIFIFTLQQEDSSRKKFGHGCTQDYTRNLQLQTAGRELGVKRWAIKVADDVWCCNFISQPALMSLLITDVSKSTGIVRLKAAIVFSSGFMLLCG